MRPDDERYFERLESGLDEALSVARDARERGGDPTDDVEIPIAKDMADRVENILGIDGVAERVREMEDDPDLSREEAALELAADFAEGSVGDYDTRAGKVEGAVRTAVALLTEGVVAAPIEGIDRVELLENDDGTEFVNIYYAGPIRSAGGTAQALSVLVADYTRTLVGIEEYRPRDSEVERYAEELSLYDDETGLQYAPKDAEAKFIARNTPIMLDGEATGDEEVSGFRDLERVDTNNARGGMCLVLGEGIAQKAPKIQRYTSQLEEVDWPWLQDLIDGNYGKSETSGEDDAAGGDDGSEADDADDDTDPGSDDGPERGGPPRPDPSKKFLRDLIAGRPVFGHPSETGGFRLRYGRARNHGFATAGVHPATMHLVDDFLATGTQIKTERPGKAAGVVPVDSIEGPTVRLANGDVRRVDDPAEALEIRNGVEAILDLGEYLVNYGEFVENNHPLSPAAYAPEWWKQDLAAAGADVQALVDSPQVDLEHPSAEQAIEWAQEYDVPLHPEYTYLWHDLDVERFDALATAASEGHWAEADGAAVERDAAAPSADRTLVVPRSEPVREALEVLLVEHTQGEETLTVPDALPLVRSIGLTADLERTWTLADLPESARTWDDGENSIRVVEEVAPFEVRERAPTRVGCRMGRPEKSEKRDLSPAVHTLFPIGEAGGSQRDIAAAGKHAETMQDTPGLVDVQVGRRRCGECGTETHRARCPECNGVTDPHYVCRDCDVDVEPDESGRAVCPRCEREADAVRTKTLDVNDEYRSALENVGERENAFDVLKGVKGLSSAEKVPEPIEKGVLRAKHGVSSFKDGTVRYDMTDLPVTAVRPRELDVDADRLRSLGYETDIHGDPLTHEDQLVELRVQDVVLSNGAAEHMLRTADFVDDLLEQYYGVEPFYEVDDRDDLVGELVFGMAPHTSAAVVGRVIGFTSAAVGYAHPYFHAAKRRNCFHPETKVWYEDEGGATRHKEIESLVEERLDDGTVERDDFGTLVAHLGESDSVPHVPSVRDDGSQSLQPVEAVSKHPAPDHMVRVATESGRELTVTPDHRVHVYDSELGRIVSAEARELDETDRLITPRGIESVSPSESERRFDLLAAFLEEPSIDNERLMVKGLDKDGLYDLFVDRLEDDWGGQFYPLQSTAEHLGLTKKQLSNYLYRESIPVTLLSEFFDTPTGLLEFVPDDVRLGMKRDRTEISRTIELDERVATLLGYYAAEGFTRAQETPKGTIHQTTICGTEAEAREFALEVFRSEFGVEPYEENDAKVTVSGRLLRTFVDSILDAGTRAHTKRVPQPIFDAPDRIVGAYLGGYFSGDGSADDSAPRVTASTVSRELKSDLLGLLTRLGISAQVNHRPRVPLREQFPEFYDEDDDSLSRRGYEITVSRDGAVRFAEVAGFHLSRKDRTLNEQVGEIRPADRTAYCYDGGTNDYLLDPVSEVEYVESETDHVYCLTVEETNSLIAEDLSARQCDGDEDCVMLLMDGLINFSKTFLPDQRGGRMDAPLVMSSRIDPAEIDDEAHNMDIVSSYPREFYEATREMADPGAVEERIQLGEDTLGTDDQYRGFEHTHDTADVALGPDLSAYKTLGDMMEKMDAQLELSRKLRSVDETDVAERVIEYHFLPDIIGNLRAFSRQETRCKDCGEKFRRMPLTGDCRECGGDVNLTVYEGSVNKYIDTALRVAEEYDCREYTVQRLEILDRSVESIFEDDTNKQSGIADFM
ncbi:DNA polymerase II large subunit [Natronomonas marina]|uniref:DNA polymerase II large subunit n=1 Tax=Natronomonas marina TaxID=2961939 RepID=UPI0020C99D1B|nr:DNA polymerase II large subunit [Natronomonas marina]